jgi:hypothetical protein
MEEKTADLWWDAIQDIVQKDIRKVYNKYERNERMYKHMIFQMKKLMPSFKYKPLILFLKPKTLDEEKYRMDRNGVGPSCTRIA